MVHHFHQQRFTERQRSLRRGEGLAERQADAVQVHALDLDALLVELAQGRAVHLADARARERIEHEQVLGLVHARQLGRNAARRLLGEYAVGNGAAALPREARGDGGGQRPGQVERRIALDEADRAAAPFLVGRAEDIGVGHTGHAQQLLADLGRVDVLPARDEHIVGAFLHVQLAVGRDGRRVAGQEEPVGRVGGARVQVAGEQPGTAHGKAAEPVGAGVHDAGLVAGKQLHAARETGQHQGVRDVAGRLGHAVAGVHAGACGQGAAERLRVQRAPAQQDAHVAAQLIGVRRRQHVLQHLVDHRDVGGAAAGGIGQHAAGVEALVEDERVRVQEAAHDHLQAAHVIQGQRRLPQPLAAAVERGVRNRRRIAKVIPGQGHGLRAAGGAGREHDHRHGAAVEHVGAAFGEMDDAFHRVLPGDVLAATRRCLAAMARAAERAGGASLGGGDVGARREGRALRMAATVGGRLGGAGGLVGNGLQQVRRVRHVDGVDDVHGAGALQVEQARLLLGIGQTGVHGDEREPAVGSREQHDDEGRVVRQVDHHGIARLDAPSTQQAGQARRHHAGFPIRERFHVPFLVDKREACALRVLPHHAFEYADHEGSAPTFALNC